MMADLDKVLVAGPGCAHNVCVPVVLCELHRKVAHPAAAGVNQYPCTRLEVG